MLVAAAMSFALAPPASAQQKIDFNAIEITSTDLGRGVFLLNWKGGDSVVLTGPDGVLLVDDYLAPLYDKLTAAVAKVSGGKPIKFLINAHAHADHFGGNEQMAKAGATIIAQENVRARMASGWFVSVFNQTVPPQPQAALPVITYSDKMSINFDGETIDLIHVPAAHTDSDSIIYFRKANVIHIGGAFGGGSTYPFYDMSTGGSLAGVIATQEAVLRLANDDTRIITDEGPPETRAALQASRDMLIKLRDRVQTLIKDGKSEDEAVAAKPTADLDATFARKGAWLTGDKAVRMAYQSLKGITPPATPPTNAKTP
jgi:glyoxylase-like metal-dependent hydrolase (beta-lactamase superfamily II)